MDLGLGQKVAVITGASVGIGLVVAEGFAAEGAHVVMAARDSARLSRETERIGRRGCAPPSRATVTLRQETMPPFLQSTAPRNRSAS